MTVIFGIIKKEGFPVEKKEMELMYNSVKHFPHDNYQLWNDKNVGFGWVQLYDTPESIYDKQPYSFYNNRYVIVSKARLDNRDDLLQIFDIPTEQRNTFPDTHLLPLAFEKWGIDCSRKLFGDWSFAIWDKVEQKLFMARDHHGVNALYYSVTSDFIAFASNKTVLLSISSVSKEVNMVQMAQLLVGWHGYAEETAYKSILRLPPSMFSIFKNNNLEITKYWNLEDVKDIRFNRDDDYVEAFKELFFKAVKARIRSYRPIGSMLSSGLDSTSVTAIAAIELAKMGKRIKSFTSAPLYDTKDLLKPSQYGDESELASIFAKIYPNIDHEIVRSENKDPLQGVIESLNIFNTPIRNTSNSYWILSINELARQQGIGTMLNGQGGNNTISWPYRGYYSTFIKSGTGFKKHLPDFIFKWRAQLKKGSKPYLINSFINPDFEKRIELQKAIKKAGFDPYYILSNSLKTIRKQIFNVKSLQGYWLAQEQGDFFGINIYDPTMDLKLLEYCSVIPDNQFVRQNSDRYLIKRAMKGKIPDQILFNEKKGKQSADLLFRLANNPEGIVKIIQQISESEYCQQVIDIKKVNEKALELNKFSYSNKKNISPGFLRAISVGFFLLQHEKR